MSELRGAPITVVDDGAIRIGLIRDLVTDSMGDTLLRTTIWRLHVRLVDRNITWVPGVLSPHEPEAVALLAAAALAQ